MEQIDQTLIERYLSNELTLAERSDVERRAKDDTQFRKDLAEYKLSIEAIKLAEREELKNRFRQRDKMLDQKNIGGRQGTQYYMLMMAVAAVISILVAWYFLYTPDRTIDEAKNETRDSTYLVQNPPVVIDTLKENKPVQPKNPSRPKSVKPAQQIFAENFEAYKDESMDIASRSDEEDLTPTDKLLLNYWEGNYKEAQEAFNNMSPKDKQNDNYRFIYANVLMSLNKTVEASLFLKGVIQNHKSPYTPEAYFYLALCDIKSGKKDEAKENLVTYIDNKDSNQKEKAKRILAGLN